jgi:FemAB-related protein (PEP-CTERM system-associated)
MSLLISECNNAQEWDGFVKSKPSGTCFHLYGWRQPLEKILGYQCHNLVARLDGVIVAILAIAVVRSSLFGTSACSLPFCSYGGPLGDNDAAIKALLDQARKVSAEAKARYLEFRNLQAPLSDVSNEGLYVTFRKPLPSAIDDWSFLPSKRRNMVRKGIKEGLTAVVSRDVDQFFELYAENARAHGTPALPKKYFVELLSALGDAADILFVFDANQRAISCIMSFYFNGEVHAGFAGELPSARHSAGNDFKYWSLVQHAIGRGCSLFDFGRSKRGTGSYEFKRLWGFDPTPIKHEYHLIESREVPNLNPTNKKFSAAIEVWRRLPRVIVDRIGPLVIHGLG